MFCAVFRIKFIDNDEDLFKLIQDSYLKYP